VAPSALRFYEEQGLIGSVRSPGNQRQFKREVLRRVAIIRLAQQAGLSLSEVAEAFAELPSDRTPRPADWAGLTERLRPRLDRQIADLRRLRDGFEGASEGGSYR
jgi:MerR family redox-sensitive transcriptional activator SoxR